MTWCAMALKKCILEIHYSCRLMRLKLCAPLQVFSSKKPCAVTVSVLGYIRSMSSSSDVCFPLLDVRGRLALRGQVDEYQWCTTHRTIRR
jgi:hypothetical protein